MRHLSLSLLLASLLAVPLAAATTAPPVADSAGPVVGRVTFANSGAAAAQASFLFGLAELHNFEYAPAAEAFRKAQEIDPGFALAYWGEALTSTHPIWMEQELEPARAVLRRLGATPALRAEKAPTEREKGYLAAVEILYGEGTKEERDFRYEAAMADLSARFPDDPDAAALHALAILGTAHAGRDAAIYMRAAAILEELICRYPDHPGVLHYLIHSYDDPVHAPLGLRAARRYAGVALDAPHAQHMTSHIFLALGDWDGVVAANENATAVMNRMREEHGRHGRGCGHYRFWLAYGYLEQGRFGDARQVLEACRSEATSDHAEGRDDPGLDPDRSSLGSLVAMWSRYLIDTEEWSGEVAGWTIDPGARPGIRLGYAFARGFAAARRGDLATARAERVRLLAAKAELDGKLAIEKPTDRAPWRRAEALADELDSALAAAEGKPAEAVERALAATRIEDDLPFAFGPPFIDKPSHELLGEALLGNGDSAGARAAFEAALERAPRRTASTRGLARASAHAENAHAGGPAADRLGVVPEVDRADHPPVAGNVDHP